MAIETTKQIIKGARVSRSIQWAIVGTTILSTLIVNEDTLTLLVGESWAKGVILGATIGNGIIVTLFRTVTTKPLEAKQNA